MGEDCGSNGFHAYAVKLEEEHEAKRVMVNPMQCASPAPPSASPAPASPILRRLALLSRFASVCAVAHSHPCIALRLSRIHKRREERTQHIVLRPLQMPHRHASFVLHFPTACCPALRAMRLRAGTPLPAQCICTLAGSQPVATLCSAVPSRVEAQARAEPSAGPQGPLLSLRPTDTVPSRLQGHNG